MTFIKLEKGNIVLKPHDNSFILILNYLVLGNSGFEVYNVKY